MKTQISYTKTDGGTGVALVDGAVDDPLEAKRELAAALNLPEDVNNTGNVTEVDARLRAGGVQPESVSTVPVSE
ncbi:hypothetical protein IMZ29_04150 [Achromobacter sp. GG226]|uniref:hypothetical protein n=1 Tax=Verticiella alkaliphila TaxID=2779529 RepID=UPI001C0AD438|nr:hypothetical protein [Verticiella sp. GG226]MBU4609767.1 hypothetical protein [Verticiella sp. GG226]